MNAVHDEQVDEIIVSTFPRETSGWLGRDVLGRIRKGTKLPVTHVVVERVRGRAVRADVEHGRLMASVAHADEHHGPPTANVSSRVDARLLGMYLFIASEIMLFGSFFTAYFFARVVVAHGDVAARGLPPTGLPRAPEHDHPRHLELLDALGAPVDQAEPPGRARSRGSRSRSCSGSTFLLIQAPRVHAPRLRPERPRLRLDLLRPDGTARCARLRRPEPPALRAHPLGPRALRAERRTTTSASRFRGSTGTSST